MRTVDDLVTWLRDQLDDDDRSARAVLGADTASWDPYGYLPGEKRDYLTRHDPARVLAEVDAKRRLLHWLESRDDWAASNNLWTWDSSEALGLLALPYADRPGYREDWRP